MCDLCTRVSSESLSSDSDEFVLVDDWEREGVSATNRPVRERFLAATVAFLEAFLTRFPETFLSVFLVIFLVDLETLVAAISMIGM